MKTLRIYLDTSVISHLAAEDAPDKAADTRRLWEAFKIGKYKAVVSNVTIAELTKCEEPKRTELLSCLNDIAYELQRESDESAELADGYLKYEVLRQKSLDDCRHIAIATVSGCDYIASWNFKHFVNIKTINKVQAVNKMLHYPEISIIPPSMLLEGVEGDE